MMVFLVVLVRVVIRVFRMVLVIIEMSIVVCSCLVRNLVWLIGVFMS